MSKAGGGPGRGSELGEERPSWAGPSSPSFLPGSTGVSGRVAGSMVLASERSPPGPSAHLPVALQSSLCEGGTEEEIINQTIPWVLQPEALPLVGLISLGVSHFQFLF